MWFLYYMLINAYLYAYTIEVALKQVDKVTQTVDISRLLSLAISELHAGPMNEEAVEAEMKATHVQAYR